MKQPLTDPQRNFILHWGEIGTRWGINRTVAKVHALLYLSTQPLNAEDISSVLSVSRSNISGCLRELQTWGIIRIVQVLGDRRDYYEAEKDVWELFLRILDERKRREIDPALVVLRASIEEAKRPGGVGPQVQRRLEDMLCFCEQMESWYSWFRGVPRENLVKMMKLGGKLQGLLSLWPGKGKRSATAAADSVMPPVQTRGGSR